MRAPTAAPRTFASRAGTRELLLIRGRDTSGREAWYYVLMDRRKEILFRKHARSGQLQLIDYGTIVASGYGKDPPDDVRRKMQVDYNFVG